MLEDDLREKHSAPAGTGAPSESAVEASSSIANSLLVEHDQPKRAIDLLAAQRRLVEEAELLAEQGELTRGVDLLVAQGLIRDAWGLVLRERYVQYCKEARRRLSGNESVAKEVSQNAFLELYKALTNESLQGNPIRNIDALLRRLLTFAIMKAWNEQRTNPTVDAISSPKELEALPEGRAMGRYEACDARHDVHRLLESLPLRDRTIFHLRYFERLKWEELGEALGMAASTARCRYSRALARLKKAAREPRGAVAEPGDGGARRRARRVASRGSPPDDLSRP